jgi:hypothetical protein
VKGQDGDGFVVKFREFQGINSREYRLLQLLSVGKNK